MRTIDGRRRTVAVLMGTTAAAGLMVLAAAAPAGAEENPPRPDEMSTTVPETTIPETTIPQATPTTADGSTPTSVTPPPSHTPTSTPTDDDGPTTTGPAPGQPATTTTLPPVPPSTDLACQGPWPSEHTFLIDESIEEGESFDDPASDFSATFTQVDFVEDHLVVTFEGSHPVDQLFLAGLYDVHSVALFRGPDEPVTTQTVELSPAFGRSIVWAAFCFADADSIGAAPPVSPTDTAVPPTPMDTPVTETVVAPEEDAAATPPGGRLPDTGNDVLPLALAGVGLASVGGGLLLGRRLRRSAA